MKQLISLGLAVALTAPAMAQDADPAPEADPPSLMERGAELFLEGLRKEMEPHIDELMGMAEQMGPALNNFLNQMGPAMTALMEEVEDWSAYDPPETLPNGDIIIRRKPDADPDTKPPATAPEFGKDGVTDL